MRGFAWDEAWEVYLINFNSLNHLISVKEWITQTGTNLHLMPHCYNYIYNSNQLRIQLKHLK